MHHCRRGLSPLLVIVALAALLGVWFLSSYNSLVRARENMRTAWSQVESDYQRRFDLVPNLVVTVKGAATFEQETLRQVTEARTKWMTTPVPASGETPAAADARAERIAAARQFDSALSRLLVTVESYPQLQATQAFRDLMTQLEGTENRINVSRKDYSSAVRDYNILVRTFPRSLIAGAFGFQLEQPFESVTGAERTPSVQF